MKNSLSVIAILLSLSALAYSLMNKAPKIGYVETSALMAEFSEAIQARKQFETHKTNWQKNIKILNDSLDAGMTLVKTEYEKASKKRKKELRQLMDKRNEDLARYKQTIQKKAQEKEAELMTPVISKVNTFLKTWGANNGYDMIFGTLTGGNIIQANPIKNLTSAVISDINKHYKSLPVAKPKKEKVQKGLEK